MEKKEVVVVVAIIVILAAVLLVSGVFYFNMVLSDAGLTGKVVSESDVNDADNAIIGEEGQNSGYLNG
ncbi:MAG: hypothetical protein ABH864_00850 [archaeon]